jgi:polysaccharide biosynthesis transport protein
VELQAYLLILRARWRMVALGVLLCVLVAVAYSVLTPTRYVARSRVFVVSSLGQSAAELSRSFDFTQGQVRAYAQLATQAVVLQPVIDGLGLDTSVSALADKVTAQAPLDSVVIDIEVSDGSAQRAADIANAIAIQLRNAPRSLDGGSVSPFSVQTLSAADPPAFASAPRRRLSLAVSLFLGLFVGTGLAIFRDALDARIRGLRDAHALTTVPVIGQLIQERSRWRRLPTGFGRRQNAEDAGRELRTNFMFLRSQRALKSVVFTSARLDKVTGVTVAGLAVALGKIGLRVLVIDADVRFPTLAARFGLTDLTGLTSVISGEIPAEAAVHPSTVDSVSVMPAGPPLPDPSMMVRDTALQAVVDRVVPAFDVVLIKAPPVLEAADGLVLGRISDGVVIVADELAMNRELLTEEIRTVEIAGAEVLGMVLITK